MSQVLLTSKHVQDNINNNSVAECVPKSRSCDQHVPSSRPNVLGTATIFSQNMGVTNYDNSKSAVWKTITQSNQATDPNPNHDNNNRRRVAKIEEGLENSVGPEAKVRINRILNEVSSLTDVEKLLLYLKLPTGAGCADEASKHPSNSSLHTGNRIQQGQAYTWITSHLELDQEICLPKHEVFEEYRSYCEDNKIKCLSTADFGKLMKCIFPDLKPRRLGQRGQSKYCYSGLRKKVEIGPPCLPDLEIDAPVNKVDPSPPDPIFMASCELVCEWAQKLLGQSFTDLRQLAEHLLGNLYLTSKSMSAFTLLSTMQDSKGHFAKGNMSQLFSNSTGGNKHKETQLQLQRKLQERELFKVQKRRLQQQKIEIEQEYGISRAGSSSERELSTPSIIHGRSSERELDTPSLSAGRSSVTPFEEAPSPSRSSMSCSPVCTPTRADSVEHRQATSETEFVSPVAIRATYRRRNSHGSVEKEKRRREKATCISSPFFEAARNILEGKKNLDRQLFVDSDDLMADKDNKSNKHSAASTSNGRSLNLNAQNPGENERLSSVEPQKCETTSLSKSLANDLQAEDQKLNVDLNVTEIPQPVHPVPIVQSRSAFVPFPQRFIGLATTTVQQSSVQPSVTSVTNVAAVNVQKSKGLTRLLLAKPRKDAVALDSFSKDQISQGLSSAGFVRNKNSSLISVNPAPIIRSSPREVNNNQTHEILPSSSSSSHIVDSNSIVTSPLTPRRTKTRFTPIKPKVPATRTVSSMLKEHQGNLASIESNSFGSKPVAEILKEKRERETLLLPVSSSVGAAMSPRIPGVSVPHNVVLPQNIPSILQSVGSATPTNQRQNSVSNPNDLYIVMGTSPSAAKTTNTVIPVKAKRCSTISIPILQKDISQHLQKNNAMVEAYQHNSNPTPQHLKAAQSAGVNVSEDDSQMETDDSLSKTESPATCKRKRKSPGSAKEQVGCVDVSKNGNFTDDRLILTDTDDCSESVSDENNPKRSKSCLPHLENPYKAESAPDLLEDRVCPDITSLESDALVDASISAAELVISLGPDSLPFNPSHHQTNMKTASVGVTSQSMKLSHKLMKQSVQLDKRIDTFLKQRSRTKPEGQHASTSAEGRLSDVLLMSAEYASKSNHKSSTRTSSDGKTNLKAGSSDQDKARSTVHRGVVQTSNSFVVKKPLASKGSTKDHFLLKLLMGDSPPTATTKKAQLKAVAPSVPAGNDKLVSSPASTVPEPSAALSSSSIFEDIDGVLSKSSDSLPQEMDIGVESELPTDVADFITEAMEKRSSSGYVPVEGSAFGISNFHTYDIQNFSNPFALNPLHSSNLSAEILSSQIPSCNSKDSLFMVPSIPSASAREHKQRRNTPVLRSVSVPTISGNSPSHSNFVNSSTFSNENVEQITENSDNSSHRPLLLRLNSVDHHRTHTPISDAGYYSFDSSPVPSTTPLPIHSNQLSNPDIFLNPVSGPDVLTDIIPMNPTVSPMAAPSPKQQTKSGRSSPEVCQSSESSPADGAVTHSSFTPIGVSGSLQVETNSLNPIKPTVTLASSSAFTSQLVTPKTNDSSTSVLSVNMLSAQQPTVSITTTGNIMSLKNPPSYQDAIQSLQRQTSSDANSSVHSDGINDFSSSKSFDSTQSQGTEDEQTSGHGISQAVFPFSYQLSMLGGKSAEGQEEDPKEGKLVECNLSSPMSGSANSDYSTGSLQAAGETEQVEFQRVAKLIKHYHANSRQQVEKRKPTILLPQILLAQINEQKRANVDQDGIVLSKGHFDLPDARYMGSTPNVDITHLRSENQESNSQHIMKTKASAKEKTVRSENNLLDIQSLLEVKLVCSRRSQQKFPSKQDSAFVAKENLSQILGGSALGEDDLQTTLDDLKSLDTQYFSNIPASTSVSHGTIPEDIRDLHPLDLNTTETVAIETQDDPV